MFLVHGLKIAALPLITLIGLQFGFLLAGAYVVESIFNWPGIGQLTLNAVASRDFPMIQGGVLVAAVAFVVLNFLVDLSIRRARSAHPRGCQVTDAVVVTADAAAARPAGRRRAAAAPSLAALQPSSASPAWR